MSNREDVFLPDSAMMDRLIDDASASIYVCDLKSKELLYLNKRSAKTCGKTVQEAKGKTCYAYLRDRESQCIPCFADSATDEYIVREYSSSVTGKHYLCRFRKMDWHGRDAMVVYMTDETERINASKNLQDLLNGLPGGAGVYDLYFDGRIQHRYLNDGYYDMLGDLRSNRLDLEGFGAIGAVHPDDGKRLLSQAAPDIVQKGMTSLDMRVKDGKGQYRWLNMRAKVFSKTNEKFTLYVSYSDIDELKKLQLRLEANQRVMQIANREGQISIWLYNLDKNQTSMESLSDPLLGHPEVLDNVPEILLEKGYVHMEDGPALLEMFDRLQNGAESSECTVRAMNLTMGRMEWQHLIYTRLHDKDYGERMAVGMAVNVDAQQEILRRYEHEQQLRLELVKDSVVYYQLNLTAGTIEEYHTAFANDSGMEAGSLATAGLRRRILNAVAPEHQAAVRDTLFSNALRAAHARDENTVSLVYRRKLGEQGLRWVKTTATIMKRPITDELVAFLYCREIDRERKDQLAMECIMDEEIESVAVLNVKSGLARLVKVQDRSEGLPVHQDFVFDRRMADMMSGEVLETDKEDFRAFFSVQHLQEELACTPIIKCTYRIRSRDGKILRKKTRAFYLDETQEDIILIRRDITYLYEEEQRQQRILRRAVDAANEANQAKSAFLSRISHDMRTPLTAILALSGEEMLQGISEAQKDDYLEKIHASGEYLRGLINDVLDMSRIENKKMVLQPALYSLKDFQETINTVIGEQCLQKNLHFVLRLEGWNAPYVMVDKVRFNQLFVNLLSNAVKFTPPGGTVEFSVQRVRRQGNMLTSKFIVRDTGIGMSPDFLPYAFDSFAQEKRAYTEDIGLGTGLGLPIAKQIVELMGGTIEVESQMGKGTTFTVVLTCEEALQVAEDAEAVLQPDTLQGLHILVCEDNPMNRKIVSKLLLKKGCQVSCAENGKIGLDMFAQSAPGTFDLILMDNRMPVMTGLEATHAIRALNHPNAMRVPIIALTADAFSNDMECSLSAGMNGHLSKPIEPKLLYATIAKQTKRI